MRKYVQKVINIINDELVELKKEYSELGQIDMLSSAGNRLQEQIKMLEGQLKAYEDILNKINLYEK